MYITPRAQEAKEKNKSDFIKFLKLLCFKGQYPENERTTTGEKIFANHESDKGLVSRIYEDILPLNIKSPIKNGQKILDVSPKKIYKGPISI